MSQDYGITTLTETQDNLLAGESAIQKPVTLLSGEGALVRGAVLAKNASTGKFVALDLESVVASENSGTGNGSATTFSKQLANAPVIPRTVTITATVGAATKTATDDGHGKLSGTGFAATGNTINYDTGVVALSFSTAPDNATAILCAYTHGVPADTHVADAILAIDTDATSADEETTAYVSGQFMDTGMTWPGSITAGQKARAKAAMEARGIIIR